MKGVRVGDIVVKCAGKPIANMRQFRAAKAQASNADAETITVEFERDGNWRANWSSTQPLGRMGKLSLGAYPSGLQTGNIG